MTNREALVSIINGFEVPDTAIDKVLIDREVDGGSEYSAIAKRAIELCLSDLMEVAASSPDYSEGKLSITIDRATLLASAKNIKQQYGEVDGNAIDGSAIW